MTFKIIFALNAFFPENHAGTEVYVLQLARYLRRGGYVVNFVIPSIESGEYEYDGFEVYKYRVATKSSNAELNSLISPVGIDEFASVLDKVKPDLVHFHSFNRVTNVWHIRRAQQMGTRIVFTTHVAGLFCMRGDLFYKGMTLCDGKIRLHRCMACYMHHKISHVALSEFIALAVNVSLLLFPWIKNFKPFFYAVRKKKKDLELISKKTDKIISIAKWMVETYRINGVENVVPIVQEVSNNSTKAGSLKASDKINLIFVGRLYPIKNIELLLEALSLVDHAKFNLTMAVIPDKDSKKYYDTIRNKYDSLGFKDWHENVTPEKVRELVSLSDILCLPSKSEVSPLAIKEAFDCGKVVLGSDIPAIRELVTHGKNGLLFESNKLESLKIILESMLTDTNLLASIKENVSPMTDMNLVYQQIEKVYAELLTQS